jgi:acylpyruvate hydrolase
VEVEVVVAEGGIEIEGDTGHAHRLEPHPSSEGACWCRIGPKWEEWSYDHRTEERIVKLATIRMGGGTTAVRVDDEEAVELPARDVGTLLAEPDWRARAEAATGTRHDRLQLDYAPLILAPEKIICVGLNYKSHILEMGHPLPEYPTLFSKYSSALIGANDELILPQASEQMDWEVELAIIIGRPVRHASRDAASAAIAGYATLNDVTARDFQNRTSQWLQGKSFEATTPLGPWLVTTDDDAVVEGGFNITCEVDGEVVQSGNTSDLVFGPVDLVRYASSIFTLRPGDVIATGTPGGVGAARTPPRFLRDDEVLTTRIEGIGVCRNRCRREAVAP